MLILVAAPEHISRGQEVTPTPSPWTTYEDTDPALRYAGTWQTFPVAGAVGGDLTGTDDPDATLMITFEGTGLRLISSAGPEGSPFEALLDTYWIQYPNSYAAQYTYGQVTAFEDLDPGAHTVAVSNGDGAIWIEAVQVQGVLLNPPAASFDFETGLPLIHSDDFENGFSAWFTDPFAALAIGDDGLALQINGPTYELFPQGNIEDVILEGRLLVGSGAAQFFVRHSGAGNYTVAVGRNGEVALYRSYVLLYTVTVSDFAPDEWHALRFVVIGNTLIVTLDGTQVIDETDSESIPSGMVGFISDAGSSFLVDDVNIYGTIVAPLPAAYEHTLTSSAIGTSQSALLSSPSTSTDRLVFTRVVNGKHELFTIASDGTGLSQLTDDLVFERTPVWSPDGTKIAFCADMYGNADIFVIDADGQNWTQITSESDDDTEPTWSPDGTQIAFIRHSDIFIVELSTGNIHALGQPYHSVNGVSWSSRGIAYTSNMPRVVGQPLRTALQLILSDGVWQGYYELDVFDDFDWSPGADQMVVDKQVGGLSIMDATSVLSDWDESNVNRQLGVSGRLPAWSPDGDRIAFVGTDTRIYLVSTEGGTAVPLPDGPSGVVYSFDWANTPGFEKCYAKPFRPLTERRVVRKNRNYPLMDSDIKTIDGIPVSIPEDATVIVSYKSVSDLSLWYYIEGYITNTGEVVILEDVGGIEDDSDGNWVFQKNLVNGPRESDGSPNAWCGLALDAQEGDFTELDESCKPTSDLTEACQNLTWNPTPVCDGGNEPNGDFCEYDYDRDNAAAYATAYAGSPDPNASPGNNHSDFFCTYNYGGAHTGCASPERPLPPNDPNAIDIDCERVTDPETGQEVCTFPTDCANFTSIAMWYGGLPMTERWFCEGIPCPTTGTSENYSWTYAGSTGQPEYIKTILPQYTKDGIGLFEPFTPTYDVPTLDANGNPVTKKMISYLDPYARPDFDKMAKIKEIWQGGHGMAKGDIVWAQKYPHMMMVAGWGPMLTTWEEIDAFWEENKNSNGGHNYAVLLGSYQANLDMDSQFGYDVPHSEYGLVPYLVDHGLHGAVEEGPDGIPVLECPECVQPRPYYTLYWTRDGYPLVGRLDQTDNAPQFIHIPDSLSMPVEEVRLSPSELSREILPPIQ